MPDPIITLTTDFGEVSPYVAAMKGVILGINPAARLVDLTHEIPPQDVRNAAFFLTSAIPCFPPGVIHVVVIDPGVGSMRAILCVEIDGHRLLAPDNGCWTTLAGTAAARITKLTEPRYWRQVVSATFHGRDIFAPAAAHLSLGVDPASLGEPFTDWVRLEKGAPRCGTDRVTGEVMFIDRFGNLITNIATVPRDPTTLIVGKQKCSRFRWVKAYADAKPGTLVALMSSSGTLEVAVAHGNAARRLRARVSTRITVGWSDGSKPATT